MNIYTNLIINTKTGRGVSKSRKFHLRCISVPKKCLRHTMRHAIVSRFQIPMFTPERNAVRTAHFARQTCNWWYELLSFLQRFVIQKPPLWNREIIRYTIVAMSVISAWEARRYVLNSCWTSRDRISKRTSTTTIGLKCFAHVCCYYRLCWVSYSSYNVLRHQVSEWSIYILILNI